MFVDFKEIPEDATLQDMFMVAGKVSDHYKPYEFVLEKEGLNHTDFAKKFGEYLGTNQLTTSQIRNIYSEVMRITIANRGIDSAYQEFLLLKPKVAYAVNRIKEPAKGAANEFQRFFDAIYDAVNSVPLEERSIALNRFKNLFEAVLAYHKTKIIQSSF